MLVLTNGILLFLIAFLLHLFFWRMRLPQHHTKTLAVIFLAVFCGGVLFLIQLRKLGLSDYAQFAVLYVSLVLAYLTTYSAIEVESPSLRMVLDIAQAGSSGSSKEDLFKSFSDDHLVGARLRDLLKDKMVVLENGKYLLTKKGEILIRLFILYRHWLKAGKGG